MPPKHHKTEFLENLARLASGIIENTTGHTPGKKIEYPKRKGYSISEEYVISVFTIAADIHSTCEHLTQSTLYLSNFRTTPSLSKAGINKASSTIYHIENHTARLDSIFNKMLILVNEVFMLGNQPKYCTEDIILKSNTIQETKVASLMAALKYVLTMHSHDRQEVIYQQHDTDNTELLYTLAKIDPDMVPEKLDFNISGEYLKKKKKELTQLDRELSGVVSQLFSNLQNEFERRHAMLKVLS